MLRDCQHGFIRGKSCTSNLLEVLDQVSSLLDNGKQVDMIYMDISKSFDKVNNGCLLQKFREFGFGGSLLQWLGSYLMGRYQCVTVLGETSDTFPVSSGTPQGSILGSMLFLIYVNNLPDSVLPCLPMTQKYTNKLSLRKMLRAYKLACLLAS